MIDHIDLLDHIDALERELHLIDAALDCLTSSVNPRSEHLLFVFRSRIQSRISEMRKRIDETETEKHAV